MVREETIIFIAGPTASGKSELAIKIAKQLNGEIINADAIQVYKDLDILSARPTPSEEAGIAHHLFGYLDGQERCSAGQWARRAGPIIDQILSRNKTAIIVGGTGLYFKALDEGLSPIPQIDAASRKAASMRLEEIGPERFYKEVTKIDPPMARLARGDTQRLLRAWEVHRSTGLALSHFQNMLRQPVLTKPVSTKLVLMPPREELYARCDRRFAKMAIGPGLEEARALLERNLSSDLPVMKALGAAELMAHLHGDLTFQEAITLAQRNTRRFAKRQMTWFRGQASGWSMATNSLEAENIILGAAG